MSHSFFTIYQVVKTTMEAKRKSSDFYNHITGISLGLLPFVKLPNFKQYVGYALLLAGLDMFGDWKRWHESEPSNCAVCWNKQHPIEKQSWIGFPRRTQRKSSGARGSGA